MSPNQAAADLPLVVAGLWIYPVKSCAGVPVPRAQATARGGFDGDREWVVIDVSAERRPGSPACHGAYGRAVAGGTVAVGDAGAAELRF